MILVSFHESLCLQIAVSLTFLGLCCERRELESNTRREQLPILPRIHRRLSHGLAEFAS